VKKREIRFFLLLTLLLSFVFVPAPARSAEMTPVHEEGRLTVTIEGPKEAKWVFRGQAYDSGEVLENIPEGKHSVVFADVPGWDSPGDLELTLSGGHTVSLAGKYVRQIGALTVKVEGPEAAKWVFEGNSYKSDKVLEGLPVGEYKVSFPEIPDWTGPGEKTVTVEKDKTVSLDEKYLRHTGTADIKVEGPEGMKWTFDGKAYTGSQTLTGIPTGRYPLAFTPVSGWSEPEEQTVEILKDKTASAGGKYIRHTGSVVVSIEGPEDAQWTFEGKNYKSGSKIDQIPTGKYALEFTDVKDWTGPGGKTVTVEKDKTVSLDEKYIRHTGTADIKVEGPEDMKWTFDGKTHTGSQTLTEIPTGRYPLAFTPVPGWSEPDEQTVEILKDKTASAGGKYIRHTGSVVVSIEGPEDAQWTFEGKNYKSGSKVDQIPTGEYALEFTDVKDWTGPGEKTITVEKDKTVSLDEKYLRHTGAADIKVEGPEGMKWTFDGKAHTGSQTLAGIPTGRYPLAFTPVPGWTEPEERTVEILKDKTASAGGKYIRHTGSVAVNIEGPEDAQWTFEGRNYKSGSKIDQIPTGKYTLRFTDVKDWTRPKDVAVEVTSDRALALEGKYVRHKGAVSVTIEGPQEARWSIGGKGSHESGETVGDLNVGPAVIAFSEAAGWTKPENARVTIQDRATARTSGKYVRHTGSVKVDITGTKDGRWSLDGKGNYPGGWVEKNIPTGTYKVLFCNVSGRIKPEPVSVTVAHGKALTLTAEYVKNTGSVTVKIDGPQDARWTVGGRGSYKSGQTAEEILPGERVVSFTYVKGWKSPPDIKITVSRDETVSAEGKYTEIQ
jgi:hypothetical protein